MSMASELDSSRARHAVHPLVGIFLSSPDKCEADPPFAAGDHTKLRASASICLLLMRCDAHNRKSIAQYSDLFWVD